jgi:hypothetical protein
MGWQNVRNFSVRFNALRYFWLKSLSKIFLLQVKGNKFSSVTLMLSTPSNLLNIGVESFKKTKEEGHFLHHTSMVVSLPF